VGSDSETRVASCDTIMYVAMRYSADEDLRPASKCGNSVLRTIDSKVSGVLCDSVCQARTRRHHLNLGQYTYGTNQFNHGHGVEGDGRLGID